MTARKPLCPRTLRACAKDLEAVTEQWRVEAEEWKRDHDDDDEADYASGLLAAWNDAGANGGGLVDTWRDDAKRAAKQRKR